MALPLRLIKASPSFAWDRERHAYYANGRRISDRQIRSWIDDAIANSKNHALGLTDQFRGGHITFESWITQVRDEIKGMHTAMTQIAVGGTNSWSSRAAGRLGQRLFQQYSYLGNLGREVESGQQRLDGTLSNRVGLFIESGRGTFEGSRRGMMSDDGKTEEMRTLGGSHHCTDCPPISDQWVPIGTLPGIGDTACLSNCNCTFQYR